MNEKLTRFENFLNLKLKLFPTYIYRQRVEQSLGFGDTGGGGWESGAKIGQVEVVLVTHIVKIFQGSVWESRKQANPKVRGEKEGK